MASRDEKKIDKNLGILILIFIFLILGILSAGWFYYQGQVRHHRTLMEYQLAAVAESKVREISQRRKDWEGEVGFFFNNLSFSKLVKKYLQNPQDREVEDELKNWLQQVRSGERFDSLLLTDAGGRIRLRIPEGSRTICLVMKTLISEALKTKKPVFSDLHREGPDKPPLMGWLVPVLDVKGDGRPLGVLIIRMDPKEFLYSYLDYWPTKSRTAESQLVRREGNEVVFLNELRFQKNAVLNLRLPLSRTEIPAVQAALGREGVVEGKAIRGVPVLAALRSIPDTPWFLVVKLDLEEVSAPLRERLGVTLFFVILLILMLGSVLALIWRHQRSVYYREKYRVAEALREREERFRQTVFHLQEGYFLVSMDGTLLDHNPAFNRILEFPEDEDLKRINLNPFLMEPETRVDRLRELSEHGFYQNQLIKIKTKHGGLVAALANARLIRNNGQAVAVEGTILDYTERYQAQEELKRLNRLYGALSQINQLVVRVKVPEELFEAACRTFVEYGLFRLAWVGWCAPHEERLTVASWAGEGADFLQGMEFPLDDPKGAFGPLTEALQKGRTFISTDFENTVWKEAAERLGFQAMAAIPLKTEGSVKGLLVIYEEKHDFFRIKELNLLEEVAEDISFALNHLAEEEKRRQAERELKLSEEKYRDLVEHSLDLICTHDLEGNLLSVNETAVRLSGYPRERLLTMNLGDILDPEFRPLLGDYLKTIAEKGYARGLLRARDAEGRMHILDFQNTLRTGSHPPVVRGTAHDVTEKFLAEERLKETLKHLQQAVETTIRVMAQAVEARDPYTAGHQKRSKALAEAIAREMGLSKERIEGLGMAASIHDLGKLSIPAEILSKPTTLSNIEFELIKSHPQNGYEILKDIQTPWPLAEIVLQHHERMNGSGYPQGLEGEEILLEARILAVADVVEAIASHRPYRPAYGIERALEEIETQQGVLFDAEVVRACLVLFREKGFRFEDN